MAILSDFYVADNDVAARHRGDARNQIDTDRVQWKGITPLELSILRAIVHRTEWQDEDMDAFDCILDVDSGSRMIHRLPDDLRDRLSRVDEQEIERLASEWSATDELECQADDIRPLLVDLRRLSQSAKVATGGVYLWNCL
ncbi:MAG: hypothetical protein MI923_24530 [Phycisphaerales bacterium]|nr:hypothetical protein [Phycisphaerales bacterium]